MRGLAFAALLGQLDLLWPSFSRRECRLPSADVRQPKRHCRPLRIGRRRALGKERG
jgi:hypothetical protein